VALARHDATETLPGLGTCCVQIQINGPSLIKAMHQQPGMRMPPGVTNLVTATRHHPQPV